VKEDITITNKQKNLFGVEGEHWTKEWQDMPEFVQEKKQEYQKIIIRFRNKEDVDNFAKLIHQNLTSKTQSIWFPKLIPNSYKNKRYVSES